MKSILFALVLTLAPAFAFASNLFCSDPNGTEYNFTIDTRQCTIRKEGDNSVRTLRCAKPGAVLTVQPENGASVITQTLTAANGARNVQSAHGVTCFVQVL